MKKNIFLSAIFALAIWMLLSACGSNPETNAALQPPETTQPDTAAPAVKTEKEDDDEAGETKGNEQKVGLGAPAAAITATVSNLAAAYTGETTASAKYAAYAKKAQDEGFAQIALLFKATSASEKIHAANHKAVLEDMGEVVPEVKPQYTVRTTQENLTDAITGETYEITTMYPDFLTAANEADNQLALTSLNYAYRTEQRHKPLYEKALVALQNNQVKTLSALYYVCPTCGNTYDSAPPKRCRVSMTNSDRFIKIIAA